MLLDDVVHCEWAALVLTRRCRARPRCAAPRRNAHPWPGRARSACRSPPPALLPGTARGRNTWRLRGGGPQAARSALSVSRETAAGQHARAHGATTWRARRTRMAVPLSLHVRTVSLMSRDCDAPSRAAVGSSSTTRRAVLSSPASAGAPPWPSPRPRVRKSARATPTRARWPPLSAEPDSPTGASSPPIARTNSSASARSSAFCARARAPAVSLVAVWPRPSATLSSTLPERSCACWGASATRSCTSTQRWWRWPARAGERRTVLRQHQRAQLCERAGERARDARTSATRERAHL